MHRTAGDATQRRIFDFGARAKQWRYPVRPPTVQERLDVHGVRLMVTEDG